MNAKKTICTIAIALLLIIIIPILFVASPWIIMALYIYLQPDPPAPSITYQEFPFTLVYELDGETIVAKDIYVCKFKGFGANESTMSKYREWSSYVKSVGNEDLSFVILQEGNVYLTCSLGAPGRYMGDPDFDAYTTEPRIVVVEKPNEFGGISQSVSLTESMFKKHSIKIISLEISEPIENEFKDGGINYTFICIAFVSLIAIVGVGLTVFIRKNAT